MVHINVTITIHAKFYYLAIFKELTDVDTIRKENRRKKMAILFFRIIGTCRFAATGRMVTCVGRSPWPVIFACPLLFNDLPARSSTTTGISLSSSILSSI